MGFFLVLGDELSLIQVNYGFFSFFCQGYFLEWVYEFVLGIKM